MFSLFNYAVVFVGIVHVILTLYILRKNIHEKEFVKTIKESLLTLIFLAFIVNVTGTVLKSISLGNIKEIYTVYPALIDTVGDVGSVVGSTATTKLALGLLKPSFSAMRDHTTQILSAWLASIIMFVFFPVLSLLVNESFTAHAFLAFTSFLIITNLIAVGAIVLISYAISILTFQKGLDPDNFVIPIESSLADSITSAALLVALLLIRPM
jgi:mgtE-like transporter